MREFYQEVYSVYKVTEIIYLKYSIRKRRFKKQFPFIEAYNKEENAEYPYSAHLIAKNEEKAIDLYRKRYKITEVGGIFEKYRPNGHETTVSNVILNAEYTVFTMEELREKVSAKDFIKYFTFFNNAYLELFNEQD